MHKFQVGQRYGMLFPVSYAVTVVRTVTTRAMRRTSASPFISLPKRSSCDVERLYFQVAPVGESSMRRRIVLMGVISTLVVFTSIGCATKKYARNRINERVTPLEARTGELEETSRRNSQDLSRISADITDVRGRADRAQSQAELALNRANDANARINTAEQTVGDLRTNIDKYTLQNTATVNFNFDSHQLTDEAKMALDELAAQIKDRENFVLELQGFADATGTEAYNNQLTQRRADAVRRYLAEQHDIPLFRMHILGFGEMRSVADNSTREGRAQNRRVEVRLMTRAVTAGSTATTVKTSATRN